MKYSTILLAVVLIFLAGAFVWDGAQDLNAAGRDRAGGRSAGAKYRYKYYPSAEFYYDLDRRLFFFREEGAWVSAPKLPTLIVPTLGNFVEIELDTDRPYLHFEKHREQYPWPRDRKKSREEGEPVKLERRWRGDERALPQGISIPPMHPAVGR